MAETIYDDFEKIYTMIDEYYTDMKKYQKKFKIKISHYFKALIGYIKENTMLICDLIDDLLNIIRKEKNLDDYNRVYVNFNELILIMLSKNKKLSNQKKKNKSYKFERLYEIMKMDKEEIIYRTRITLKLLQHLWEHNKDILDDKIDKLIYELLNDYEMCLNYFKEYIANDLDETNLNESFEKEIKSFENQ